MISRYIKIILISIGLSSPFVSCEDDLNLEPEDTRLTPNNALKTEGDYRASLAKIYAGFSLGGQRGPSGNADLKGLDEGFSNYIRLYWKLQELTTDEAVIGWDDGTIKDLHSQTWTSGNEFIRTMYDRIYYQIALCNEYLRQSTDDNISSKGISGDDTQKIKEYRAEARFMRALSYWHAMDLFGNPTLITENEGVGAIIPNQTTRAELFKFVESELLAVQSEIVGAKTNQYGRADQAAVWTVLAKMYLNAKVYLGKDADRFNDCITYCEKIIGAGYSINTSVPYENLFLADNNKNGAESEFIFTIPFDGKNTISFGGITFLVHASVGGSMNPRADFGINGGWNGPRSTSALINTFGAPTGEVELFERDDNGTVIIDKDTGEKKSLGFQKIWDDKRLLAYTPGQNKEINDISSFGDGYAIQKYKNVTSTGVAGSDPDNHPDTDFPMFRLADVYLMYAEATINGGNGSKTTAVGYLNQLRERAHGNTTNNITEGDLTNDWLIDERARELYWEGHRRTDLIRFNKFSENGIWPFKGNVASGKTTDAFRNIMPIPAKEISINPKIKQNFGY